MEGIRARATLMSGFSCVAHGSRWSLNVVCVLARGAWRVAWSPDNQPARAANARRPTNCWQTVWGASWGDRGRNRAGTEQLIKEVLEISSHDVVSETCKAIDEIREFVNSDGVRYDH
jgi:hypothetical protein